MLKQELVNRIDQVVVGDRSYSALFIWEIDGDYALPNGIKLMFRGIDPYANRYVELGTEISNFDDYDSIPERMGLAVDQYRQRKSSGVAYVNFIMTNEIQRRAGALITAFPVIPFTFWHVHLMYQRYCHSINFLGNDNVGEALV